jgi:two-component system OmpR family sensor kinase
MTLRFRLGLAAGVLLGLLGVIGYLLIQTVQSSQLQQVDRQLTAAMPIVLGYARGPAFPPPSIRPPANSGISDVYLALIIGGHRAVQLSPKLAAGQAPRVPASPASLDPRAVRPITVNSVSASERWRAVLISPPGAGQKVLLAVSLARADATASRLRLAVLVAGLAVLLVLAACGFWLERLGLRPIAEVTEVADAIAAGDRSRRLASGRSGTEAAHLGRAFNIMLDEQQGEADRLREFVANASHELRTPVAAIRGFAELWNLGHLRSGQPLEDAMRRIGQESTRMAGLVEDLLLLARLDEGLPLDPTHLDLVTLAHDAVLDASATHPSREIRTETDGPVIVEGHEAALRQVIANLLTNALAHTRSNHPVTLRVTQRASLAVLEVADNGPGMNPDDAARAFDRFWRGEASRSRPGTGLGLPIVAAIVSAHGGDLEMHTGPNQGTTVRVVVPVAIDDNKPATDVQAPLSLTSQDAADGTRRPDRALRRPNASSCVPSSRHRGPRP